MSDSDSGLFEQLTKRALQSGTVGFFRGILGWAVSFIAFSYVENVPIEYQAYVKFCIFAFFIISLVYTAFCMLSSVFEKLPRERAPINPDPKGLPDFTRESDESFNSKLQDAWERILKDDPSSRGVGKR